MKLSDMTLDATGFWQLATGKTRFEKGYSKMGEYNFGCYWPLETSYCKDGTDHRSCSCQKLVAGWQEYLEKWMSSKDIDVNLL